MKKTIVALAAAIAFSSFVSGASALSIADGTPPDGQVGVPYFYQFKIREDSGSYPMTWIVPHSGVFPPGLRTVVSSDTRTLTVLGVPTQAGVFNFYIQVRDAPGPWVCCTEVPYSIPIKPEQTPPQNPQEPNLTEAQFPYTGPYYGPDVDKKKHKGNTALALKLVMRNLGYGSFANPDRYYNRPLVEAMRQFQVARGILGTGNYGLGSWNAVRAAHLPDGRLAAGQTARVLVQLEAAENN